MQKWKIYTHENAHDQLNNLSYTQVSNLMSSTNKTKMGNRKCFLDLKWKPYEVVHCFPTYSVN